MIIATCFAGDEVDFHRELLKLNSPRRAPPEGRASARPGYCLTIAVRSARLDTAIHSRSPPTRDGPDYSAHIPICRRSFRLGEVADPSDGVAVCFRSRP